MGFSFARTIFSFVGAIFCSFYIIYDTKSIIGGKKYRLQVDDYVFGVVALYVDIIGLFLYLLSILGSRK